MAVKKDKSTTQNFERPPVVVVMGHVDHGKTTLLDTIRKTQVAQKEHGAITQHIGAYQVELKSQSAKGKSEVSSITFIDTPGHAAFQAMRARGVTVADIAILVVAADDSVKPQTVEAINHIKTAGIPMIVAINKVDLPSADVNRVKKDLAMNEIFVEGYGGDTVVAEISAKTGKGVEDLLEVIALVAQMEELKGDAHAPLMAAVIESRVDLGKGPVASVIVQQGTMVIGKDYYIEGKKFRVRNLLGDRGQVIKEATPSTPVEVIGLPVIPAVGSIITQTLAETASTAPAQTGSAIPNALAALKLTPINEVPIVLKADVGGSLEAIVDELIKLNNSEAAATNQKIRIVSSKTGDITESDIHFAKATSAIVLGFNVRITAQARTTAQVDEVPYKIYQLIYELLDDVTALCETGIETLEKKPKGLAEVVALFPTPEKVIAGVKVLEGRLRLGEQVSVTRGEEYVSSAKIKTMRHLKEDVKEISKGMEAGVVLDAQIDFAVGDVIQYSP